MQVVTGKDAKRGRGSLFVAPAKGKAKSDSNSFLATDDKGTPIKGLPAGGSSFTLAAWFRVSASQSGSFGILSFGKQQRGQSSQLKATSSGRAVATLFGQEGLSSNNTEEPLEHAQWHHAAVVYDNSTRTQTMFMDGRVSSRRVLAEAPNVAVDGAGATFFLGLSANVDGAESEQFAGFLDDVAIFRVALLEAEVRRIARGSFTPYLDLYSLRGCTTHVGRRYHGGTFVRGAQDEHISIDNDKFKYGFQADSQLVCSLKCAQTTNCRQAVFMAEGGDAAAAGADAASPSKRAGRCYLLGVAYTSYESDRSATTTVCRTPSAALQKVSFNLKLSADFDAQLALRDARLLKAKMAANKFGNKANSVVEPKKGAKANGKGEAKTKAKGAVADSAALRSVKAKERSAAKAAIQDAKLSLKERYERKIASLQRKVEEQAAALRAAKAASKAQSRAQKAAAAASIAALKARTRKLSKALAKKASEADLIAQAEAIRLAADAQADQILRAARKKADEIRQRRARKAKKAARKAAKKAVKRAAKKAEKAMERALAKMEKKATKSVKKAVNKSAKAAAKKEKEAAKKKF